MTIIVWDGKTLAADRMRTSEGKTFAGTKIFKHNNHLIGTCGYASSGTMMVNWFTNATTAEDWPKCQEHEERWSAMLVIDPDKRIWLYGKDPHPFEVEEEFYAMGSGCHFATAALALGKKAVEAVELANRFSPECGLGVDWLEHDEGVAECSKE